MNTSPFHLSQCLRSRDTRADRAAIWQGKAHSVIIHQPIAVWSRRNAMRGLRRARPAASEEADEDADWDADLRRVAGIVLNEGQ